MTLRSPQFWLAELDRYDNPKLVDGSHDAEQGAHHALYLHQRLGLAEGRRYAVARVELIPAVPDATGANEEALDINNAAHHAAIGMSYALSALKGKP